MFIVKEMPDKPGWHVARDNAVMKGLSACGRTPLEAMENYDKAVVDALHMGCQLVPLRTRTGTLTSTME